MRVLAGFKRRAAATRLVVDSVIEGSLREQMSGARDEAITEPLDFPSVGTGGVVGGSRGDVNETVPAAATHGTPRERRR